MIRFKVPSYDWALVSRLSKLDDAKKAKLWARSNGRIGRLKDDLTAFLRNEQNNRCAYCMCNLFESAPARDHIAPKAIYPAWTFRPDNIVIACYACNTDRKGEYDPVSLRARKYRNCQFTIVHPYFDNPGSHMLFTDGGTNGALVSGVTEKGRSTIRLFRLMEPERAKQRASDSLHVDRPNKLQVRFKALYLAALNAESPLKPATGISL